jgi:acetylornithine deacetylase/succinyl-diaminopimelate desuccinylase-like protein
MICDTGMFDPQTPAITTMLRGLLGQEVIITGPERDLHSGMYGGAAMNPARVLARILADLHDEEGRIQVPGFYDGVADIPDDLRAQWEGLGFDAEAFLGAVGLKVPAGEAGSHGAGAALGAADLRDQRHDRGLYGRGLQDGAAVRASAKVSFRLVSGQDPARLREAFQAFVRARVPADCKVEFINHSAGPASVMATDHPAFEAARQALSDEWPREAAFIGCGGSIPIAGYFKTILGMDSLLIGFGRDDDQIHSPNEKYDLECFHKGIRSWARVLAALARA